MSTTFSKNRILNGTEGRVWLDNERLANIKSFEAKVSANYEDVNINGEYGTQKRYMGYSVSGTATLHAYNSLIVKKYQEAMKTGDIPDITIVASISDPQTNQTQRVRLNAVCFDELTLLKFENNTLLEEEVPFTAGSYDFLDLME